MKNILANVDVGRKNVLFGILLFLILGVVVGVPLTINFFGGSILSDDQYMSWKVVHGYGVFLGFINYFFGLLIDRLGLRRREMEISSWSFLAAGFFGGVIRMILVFGSALDVFGLYASLGETVSFFLGTILFVRGQMQEKSGGLSEQGAPARYARAK